MEMLIKSDPRLYRAYLLKEKLRLVFRFSYDEAVQELDKWLAWAQRCRIKEFVELSKGGIDLVPPRSLRHHRHSSTPRRCLLVL